MISTAYAMAQAPSTGSQTAPSLFQSPLIPMIGLFMILYFMMIRPQRKKETSHKKFLEGLKKGDEVITQAGIYGKVAGIAENAITLEIASGVRIRVQKYTIA